MDFASVEFLSVTYLGLYIARKCKTQQPCKQTHCEVHVTSPTAEIYSSHDEEIPFKVITFFNHMNETNSLCNGLKKRHSTDQCMSSMVGSVSASTGGQKKE